jgi:hypothetical protein
MKQADYQTKCNTFQEMSRLTREEAKDWLQENKAERYLSKAFPELQENQILIVRAAVDGRGKNFFIKEVENQEWLSAYLARGSFYSKEFYILNI